MTLGEALTLRRRQAERLNDLKGRIKASALVQEGDSPQEDPEKLIAEYRTLSEQHGQLVRRINYTNGQTQVPAGGSLLDYLSDKEHANRVRNLLNVAADAATVGRGDYRFSRSEVKFVPTIDIAQIRAEVAAIQEVINGMDAEIQAVNWKTELI